MSVIPRTRPDEPAIIARLFMVSSEICSSVMRFKHIRSGHRLRIRVAKGVGEGGTKLDISELQTRLCLFFSDIEDGYVPL